jgi:hypothetical protein
MPAADQRPRCSNGVVRDHLPMLLEHARNRAEHGFGYPRFVERELEKFLACRLLCHGFVRVRCDSCGRGAAGRVLVQDPRVLSIVHESANGRNRSASRRPCPAGCAVPTVGVVVAAPGSVLFARDADLLGQVVGVFLRKVFAWQRRRARADDIADPHCGAVTFVQRFGSMLNLSCMRTLWSPDGVFTANPEDSVLFHTLPPPGTTMSPSCSSRSPARSTVSLRAISPLTVRTTRSIYSPPSRRKPSPRCPHATAHRCRSSRVADPRSSMVTPCTPITSSTKRIAMAGAAVSPRRAITGRQLSALDPFQRTRGSFVQASFARWQGQGRVHRDRLPASLATLIPPPFADLTRYDGVFAPNHHLRAAIVPAGALGDAEMRPLGLRYLVDEGANWQPGPDRARPPGRSRPAGPMARWSTARRTSSATPWMTRATQSSSHRRRARSAPTPGDRVFAK